LKLGRVAVLLPLALLATAVFGIPAVLSGLLDRTGHWPREIAGAWGRTLLWLFGVNVVVRGSEHLPHGPALYAANHGSALDIPIVFGHLPVDFASFTSDRCISPRSWDSSSVEVTSASLGQPFKAAKSLQQAAERIRAAPV
jgi:hypothetical protein